MKKLWQKNYSQNEIAEAYCFGDTIMLDNKLIVFDVLGSIAHAQMLLKIGILKHEEFSKLKKILILIIKLVGQGKFKVEFGDEDVHTKVENYLTEKLGEIGKKIHTGRSRNDQVLLDLRLYTKNEIFQIADSCIKLANSYLSFAQKYEFIPMPGYTHMQKAMPSSIGMWAGSFAESLLDDLEILKSALIINDQSPLGSGAAYGVSLPIDRQFTAKLLGFNKVQNNSLYSQNSRGKSHFALMHALTQIMLTLSRFAQDLLLFTTSEFNFFTIDEELCTGSSIMPQKKNLDVMEIVRARTQTVISYTQSVASIISGLPSGYNADFGETKFPFMKAMEITLETINICDIVLQSLQPDIDILKSSCTPELFATHAAYQLVEKGMSFREAYKKIGLSLNKLPRFDVGKVLKVSNHLGGLGNLGLEKRQLQVKTTKNWWDKKHFLFKETINKLKGGEFYEK